MLRKWGFFILGVALILGGSLLAHAVETSGGVTLHDVRFPGDGGKVQSALIYQPAEAGLANGYIGSATISADQNIVCEVNQDQNEGADAAVPNDQLFAYDAIVKP